MSHHFSQRSRLPNSIKWRIPAAQGSIFLPVLTLLLISCANDGDSRSASHEQTVEAVAQDNQHGAQKTDGAPIEAPDEAWTWIPFDDARCANGSSTGIGVNLTDRSDELLIFLEGGGACWDYESCYVDGMASNLGGYDEEDFWSDRYFEDIPLFSRTRSTNPFIDANYIYIPYCTGDVHDGDNIVDYTSDDGSDTRTTYFVGGPNMDAYLSRIVPTFPATSRVWVGGWSAGGFGAAFNWFRVQGAFPKARVDLIDDSGPVIMPSQQRWDEWISAWNPDFPDGCVGCYDNIYGIYNWYSANYDGSHRFAILSYTRDTVISSYYEMSRLRFSQELRDMAHELFDPRMSFKYFIVNGPFHVVLPSLDIKAIDGQELNDWLFDMVTDSSDWKSTEY